MHFLSRVKDDSPHFTPHDFVQYAAASRGMQVEDFGVSETMVLAFAGLRSLLLPQCRSEQNTKWLYPDLPLYTCEFQRATFSAVRPYVGAAGTVMLLEELHACGACTFLYVGMTGSLQPDLKAGQLVVPTAGVREEGTSYHYLPASRTVKADRSLRKRIERASTRIRVPIREGPVWTTDAPYREMHSKIDAYRRQGVLAVDMETSAMLAFGVHRRARVAGVLIVSDELYGEWKPKFDSPECRRGLSKAVDIVLRVVTEL